MQRNSFDQLLGPALFVDVEGDVIRIDGHRILGYSAWNREAYGDPGDDVPGCGLLIWSLSPEQVTHLIERCPGRRLASECVVNEDKVSAVA
jgi:hypothetical protein